MDVTAIVRTNPFALAAIVADDMGVAIARVDETVGRINTLIASHGTDPLDDASLLATKDARIGAARVNQEAQARLEPHIEAGLDLAISSRIQNADAKLEDVNWQLAKKPSPDGRFNGVDLGGALRDSVAAREILSKLTPAVTSPSNGVIRQAAGSAS